MKKNAGAVLRYLESWHRIEPGTGGTQNDQPMNRKERGTSRPPMSDKALELTKANEEAAGKINPVLASVLKDPTLGSLGNSYADLLAEHIYDPGALRRWRAGQTLEDREKAGAFWELCLIISQRIHSRCGEVELKVVSHPADSEADSPRQAAARDREAQRRGVHAEAHRRRVKALRAIQERENLDEDSAIWLWVNEYQMSKATIKRSLAFVANEEAGRKDEDLQREAFSDVQRGKGDDGNGAAA